MIGTNLNSFQSMDSSVILYHSFGEESKILEMMFYVDTGNCPKISSFSLKGYFEGLRLKDGCTLPPVTEYSFSMLVKVNLTPGSLSLIPISKWMQKSFSGAESNST